MCENSILLKHFNAAKLSEFSDRKICKKQIQAESRKKGRNQQLFLWSGMELGRSQVSEISFSKMINPLNQVNVTLLALRHTQAAYNIEVIMRRPSQIHLNRMSKCTRGYCILHPSSAAHEKPLGSETGPGGILSYISPVCHLAPHSVNRKWSSAVRVCQTRATESVISLRVVHGENNVNEKKREIIIKLYTDILRKNISIHYSLFISFGNDFYRLIDIMTLK